MLVLGGDFTRAGSSGSSFVDGAGGGFAHEGHGGRGRCLHGTEEEFFWFVEECGEILYVGKRDGFLDAIEEAIGFVYHGLLTAARTEGFTELPERDGVTLLQCLYLCDDVILIHGGSIEGYERSGNYFPPAIVHARHYL